MHNAHTSCRDTNYQITKRRKLNVDLQNIDKINVSVAKRPISQNVDKRRQFFCRIKSNKTTDSAIFRSASISILAGGGFLHVQAVAGPVGSAAGTAYASYCDLALLYMYSKILSSFKGQCHEMVGEMRL
jgi:hypothetical protein